MPLKRRCRSSSCHTRTHRLSQCRWPKTQGLLPGEGQSSGLQTEVIFLCPHRAEKTEKPTLRSLRRRARIPPQGPHPNDLIPSQRPHLLTASHEVLARQHLNGGGHNIQSTARTETQTFLEVDTGRGHDTAATCVKGPGSCGGLLPGVGVGARPQDSGLGPGSASPALGPQAHLLTWKVGTAFCSPPEVVGSKQGIAVTL